MRKMKCLSQIKIMLTILLLNIWTTLLSLASCSKHTYAEPFNEAIYLLFWQVEHKWLEYRLCSQMSQGVNPLLSLAYATLVKFLSKTWYLPL